MVTYCNRDLGVVAIPRYLPSLPVCPQPVEVIYTVDFLSHHPAHDGSDDATQNSPNDDTQSTRPCEEAEG